MCRSRWFMMWHGIPQRNASLQFAHIRAIDGELRHRWLLICWCVVGCSDALVAVFVSLWGRQWHRLQIDIDPDLSSLLRLWWWLSVSRRLLAHLHFLVILIGGKMMMLVMTLWLLERVQHGAQTAWLLGLQRYTATLDRRCRRFTDWGR